MLKLKCAKLTYLRKFKYVTAEKDSSDQGGKLFLYLLSAFISVEKRNVQKEH